MDGRARCNGALACGGYASDVYITYITTFDLDDNPHCQLPRLTIVPFPIPILHFPYFLSLFFLPMAPSFTFDDALELLFPTELICPDVKKQLPADLHVRSLLMTTRNPY